MLNDIDHLATDIGPREATSDNFAEAADWVEQRFESLGYDVRRTKVSVPAGNSWGTPVRQGSSVNVIAEPRGFDAEAKHLVVGAHLDTIPVAPGAEDNASGVAVLLELARLAAAKKPEVPVQFIAFGAEEPRGEGDALHHFGSQQYVAGLPGAHRRAVRAMVSLDRVGVRAGFVPVCRADDDGIDLRAEVRRAARRVDGPDSGLRQPQQRPLVVRQGRRAGGAYRQRPLRRLPLPRRRARGGRPASARTGGQADVGLAARPRSVGRIRDPLRHL